MVAPKPKAPPRLLIPDYNSYFCKNCGTRLIHTTPVSSPHFHGCRNAGLQILPLLYNLILVSLRLSCPANFFCANHMNPDLPSTNMAPVAEQESRLR